LTSLFGGIGEAERLPNMGAVEPSWEKAIDPLEHETAGERGAGLGFRLDVVEMEERRLIHEARRDEGYLAVSASEVDCSLGAYPFTPLGDRSAVTSSLVILTIRPWERASWVGLVAMGTREAGATGVGSLQDGAVAAMAVVCTAVGIELAARSCAGAALFSLEWEESVGVSRPNDRPTADVPTTVAVAQSCIT